MKFRKTDRVCSQTREELGMILFETGDPITHGKNHPNPLFLSVHQLDEVAIKPIRKRTIRLRHTMMSENNQIITRFMQGICASLKKEVRSAISNKRFLMRRNFMMKPKHLTVFYRSFSCQVSEWIWSQRG